MSYCRFSSDSDVYAYPAEDGFVCCGCDIFDTRAELATHLLRHLDRGDRVPNYAFQRLFREIREEGHRNVATVLQRMYKERTVHA